MSNFALDTNTSYGDVISSVNYLLANLPPNLSANAIIAQAGNVVTVNSNTGALSSNSVGTLSYLYDYVNIKYANSSTGGTGFTSNSTMATYYGTHNTTDGSISNNPVDYQWVQVAGGFGTTKGLYHTNLGGGKVYFAVATVAPSIYYTPVIDDQPIFLQNLANSIVVANSIQPGAVTNVAIAANTIIGTNIQDQAITALQIASRTLTNAQIALSTITGNLVQSQTLTGSLIALNTITGNLVAQNTITGNLIVPGTITGNLITANTTITSTITSYGVTPGVNSGYGFWMTSNVGDAYFGGNITIGNNGVIGNNLTIGNNAVIGGNLTVAGLITSANLNANTVATSTMQLNSATTTGAVNNSGYVINNPIVSFGSYDGSYYNYLTGNLIPAGGVVQATTSIVTNVISGYLDVSGVTNTNGIFGVPQMYAELYRTTDGINFTPISQTFITTPASQQFNATYAQTTQTLLPVRLSAVSIVDVFTITSPTNVGYYWLWGAYISQTSNVKPIQSNVTLGTYGVTVTNYKR